VSDRFTHGIKFSAASRHTEKWNVGNDQPTVLIADSFQYSRGKDIGKKNGTVGRGRNE